MVACVCRCKGNCGKVSNKENAIAGAILLIAIIALAVGIASVTVFKGRKLESFFVTDRMLVDPVWLKGDNDRKRAKYAIRCQEDYAPSLSTKIITQEKVDAICATSLEYNYGEKDWVEVARNNNRWISRGKRPYGY
jgi:hypothetical protein